MAKRTGLTPRRVAQLDAYTLTDLEQIKVIADPLRIRVLEGFCEERTTKQVAAILGERVTKLYHHVEALERVGLIGLTRTRPNRGTTEKYYLAVARTFRADTRAFQATGGGVSDRSPLRQMIGNIFDTTAAEIGSLMDRGDEAVKALEAEGVVSFLEIRGTAGEVEELGQKLRKLVESVTAPAKGATHSAERAYRLTVAYYPLVGLPADPVGSKGPAPPRIRRGRRR